MNLSEFKKHVEEQRAQSLQNALVALTNANAALTKTFNVEDK